MNIIFLTLFRLSIIPRSRYRLYVSGYSVCRVLRTVRLIPGGLPAYGACSLVPPAAGSPCKECAMTITPSPSKTGSASTSSAAANALSLLLREDPRLAGYHLVSFASPDSSASKSAPTSIVAPNEEAAFAFAASLMHDDTSREVSGWISPSIHESGSDQSRAKEALAEVDRKLGLVTGLVDRLVRDHPDGVSETLLRLHGCSAIGSFVSEAVSSSSQPTDSDSTSTDLETSPISASNNLVNLRAKCDRLTRQSHVMESVASRVLVSLQKQYDKLHACTTRLQRVLALSSTLKMAMRLQFESKKIMGCGIDLNAIMMESSGGDARRSKMLDVDLRDLTRAASSVATMEMLLADPELYGGEHAKKAGESVDIVNAMRPEVRKQWFKVSPVLSLLVLCSLQFCFFPFLFAFNRWKRQPSPFVDLLLLSSPNSNLFMEHRRPHQH